ncbi:MAG: DUF3786 domain-containing protein [Desulfobacteraceae bacterium]|nr:DUF3786 domain-containing protein [Desulfobacteraceae bacterium]MBC2757329.1 DUF3786 domain-containing protein [Desulfobacteraceae bacterium]
MAELKNTMEIFKLLDKSNCRECNEKTCLAFAAAVFKGKRQIGECPHLDRETIEKYSGKTKRAQSIEEDMADAVAQLKGKIPNIDLTATADRVGGRFSNDKLTIRIFGRNFSVDSNGRLFSDIHINPWLAIPVLNYILEGGETPVSGKWVPFRELSNGMVRNPLFQRRCEDPLKRVADEYTDFFADLLDIFDGKQVDNLFDSDISIVLYPLPLVPMLICYWKPEEGMESSFHLFFDATAEDNLHIDSIYTLTAGFVHMFEKIAIRHAVK